MKHVIAFAAIGASLLVSSTGMTLAGQPGTNAGQNCDLTNGPVPGGLMGGAATTSQSPFNSSGTSGSKYANTFNGPNGTNMGGNVPSPNAPLTATSQYDIACAGHQVK